MSTTHQTRTRRSRAARQASGPGARLGVASLHPGRTPSRYAGACQPAALLRIRLGLAEGQPARHLLCRSVGQSLRLHPLSRRIARVGRRAAQHAGGPGEDRLRSAPPTASSANRSSWCARSRRALAARTFCRRSSRRSPCWPSWWRARQRTRWRTPCRRSTTASAASSPKTRRACMPRWPTSRRHWRAMPPPRSTPAPAASSSPSSSWRGRAC